MARGMLAEADQGSESSGLFGPLKFLGRGGAHIGLPVLAQSDKGGESGGAPGSPKRLRGSCAYLGIQVLT